MSSGLEKYFCPECNKGRQNKQLPLYNTVLCPILVEGILRCPLCKRLFKDGKEVIVEVKEKPEPGQDLRKMIPDWYRCPLCHKVCAGDMEWASHTWQVHKMVMHEFEAKYGKPEYSYYGCDFHPYFNPSER